MSGALPGSVHHPWARHGLLGVLVLAVLTVIAPFVLMLVGGFQDEAELRQRPGWPRSFTLDNYTQLFAQMDFGRYFVNSLFVATVVTAGNLLFCSMLGYALAFLQFPGKRTMFATVMGTLMIPGVVTFVPLFVLVARLGLVDSLPGLVLPFLVTPYGVFLMRQFIGDLPGDLLDAGRVDGASELRIFWQVVLPLCTPALATLAILTFLGSWNSFLWPLVIAQSEDTYTLPVALALYSTGQNQTRYGLLLAGASVVVVPVVLVFLACQRRIIEGIATTGFR